MGNQFRSMRSRNKIAIVVLTNIFEYMGTFVYVDVTFASYYVRLQRRHYIMRCSNFYYVVSHSHKESIRQLTYQHIETNFPWKCIRILFLSKDYWFCTVELCVRIPQNQETLNNDDISNDSCNYLNSEFRLSFLQFRLQKKVNSSETGVILNIGLSPIRIAHFHNEIARANGCHYKKQGGARS